MPGSHNNGMIDGFHSVQAAKRAAGRGAPRSRSAKKPETPPPPTPPPSSSPPKAQRIGHTAMPTRHEIVCYSCMYSFSLTGRMEKIFCPKCKEQLESGDITIDGSWTKDIRTVGKVIVAPDAIVKDIVVVATDIIVAGDVLAADLRPSRRLQLDSSAAIDLNRIEVPEIIIRRDARISFKELLHGQDFIIRGELNARLRPTGTVTIHPGGYLRGELHGRHLVVHEGGGLKAKLHISPDSDGSDET